MFEQYDIFDIEYGDVWTGSIYDPGMISSDWVSEWVSSYDPTNLTDIYSMYYNPDTGQLELPLGTSASAQPIAPSVVSPVGGGGILQSVFSAGTSIAASLLAPKATTPTTIPRTTIPLTTQPSTILSSLTSNLPLLGVVGIGAYFLLKKKRGKK